MFVYCCVCVGAFSNVSVYLRTFAWACVWLCMCEYCLVCCCLFVYVSVWLNRVVCICVCLYLFVCA